MKEFLKMFLLMLSFCLIREVKFFEIFDKLLRYQNPLILTFWFIIYFSASTAIILWIEELFQKK
ncbi:hypothetical protein Sterm_2847 [Sebaldella termitidis ATCC 33386]|uniref:Uncharacterized protein n=3 Tax=Sebaldella TaxID=32068 RepID=D1AN87_SEBTE|nr:hypothetical protein Sterm_2847 [Sebaldella termitidis ATCC 33386]